MGRGWLTPLARRIFCNPSCDVTIPPEVPLFLIYGLIGGAVGKWIKNCVFFMGKNPVMPFGRLISARRSRNLNFLRPGHRAAPISGNCLGVTRDRPLNNSPFLRERRKGNIMLPPSLSLSLSAAAAPFQKSRIEEDDEENSAVGIKTHPLLPSSPH